ncbi:MAG: hypothetical protein ACO3SZ_09480, partial [Ilumatobacteraceae bacterium]
MQRFVRDSGIVADAVLVATGVTAPANAATATTASLGAPAVLSLNGTSPYADLLPHGTVRRYFPSPQSGRTAV